MRIHLKMAWRNIWRNPRRTILTVMAIAFACVLLIFMLSFQFGSYDTMINSSVKINTGHIQVQARGYNEKKKMRLVIPDPAAVYRIFDRMPEINAYTSRARTFALVSSDERSYGVMIVGVEPAREAGVSTLGQIIRQGSYLSDTPADTPADTLADTPDDDTLSGALLGRLLARNLKVQIGDEVTILGQGRDGSVGATVARVQGIYDSGMDEFDRNAIHIPLSDFQEVFSMESAVHEIVVMGSDLDAVAAIKTSIKSQLAATGDNDALTALDWDELMPGLRQAIRIDLVSGAISYLILIMVVAFSILNTFLMAILERTHEFGVMMAVGTKPGRITRLVLTESAGMTLVGVAAGMVLGCLLTSYFQIQGIELAGSSELLRQYGIPSRLYPRLSLLSATAGPMVVFVITLLAALYPALKIRRLKPVDAINYV